MGKYTKIDEMSTTQSEAWVSLKSNLEKESPEMCLDLQGLTLLDIKVLYVIGLLSDICDAVTCLLKQNSYQQYYLPAFGVFSSGVELLGRCLTGWVEDTQGTTLQMGFYYLAKPSNDAIRKTNLEEIENTVVVTSNQPVGKNNSGQYTVRHLICLRNYSDHGQAIAKRTQDYISDLGYGYDLMDTLPHKLSDAIKVYLFGLKSDDAICRKLAQAKITPFCTRYGPLRKVLGKNPQELHKLFADRDWCVLK